MKTFYIVYVSCSLYHSGFLDGFVIATGRSLDKGFITPVTVRTLDEAKKLLQERYYNMNKIAMKKYLFKTKKEAEKFGNSESITHVVNSFKIYEVKLNIS